MKKKIITLSICASLFAGYSCTEPKADAQADLTQYVDPYIGSGGHGHVFVGANVPYGLVQLGPASIPQEWDLPAFHRNGTGHRVITLLTLRSLVSRTCT